MFDLFAVTIVAASAWLIISGILELVHDHRGRKLQREPWVKPGGRFACDVRRGTEDWREQ